MDVNELYRKLRTEGKSVGHAQWCIGWYYLSGKGLEENTDLAEEWLLKAWGHHFPGTALTQAFILKRQWQKFIEETYSDMPRMLVLLSEATASSDERDGAIYIPVHNVAQKQWVDEKVEEMATAFCQFLDGRFFSMSIKTVVQRSA